MNGGATPELELALGDVRWVRALARGLVRDPHAAEDLAQEAWLAALRTPGAARGGLRLWLSGVARNLAQRRLRRPEARAAGALEDAAERRATPAELLAQADFQRRVLAAVTALDEPYRTTVLLRYFEDLSVEELSRRTGVPGSTGRTRLQRAHEKLRERLDRECGTRGAWSALAGSGAAAALPGTLTEIAIMSGKALWIAGGVLVVGGVAAWRVLEVRRGEPEALAKPAALVEPEPELQAIGYATAEPGAPRAELAAVQRTPDEIVPTSSEAPSVLASSPAPSQALSTRIGSPVEQSLDLVADSFLTDRPQVAQLLNLVRDMAGAAMVLPDSVELTTNTSGAVVRAAGKLAIGGLQGTFEYDRDGYRVGLPKNVEDVTMFRREVSIWFRDQDSRASGCSVHVQFHPRTNDPASAHLAPDEERFTGWSVGISLENGARANPMTMRAEGGAWIIGREGRAEPQEFPWLYDTSAFDAWLRVLRPHLKR